MLPCPEQLHLNPIVATNVPFLRRALIVVFLLVAQGIMLGNTKPPLPPRYRDWVDHQVAYIITADEKNEFLKLSNDAERDKFIDRFWEIRNPAPGAPTNPYKEEHYRRLAYADQFFGLGTHTPGWRTAKGRIYITLGEPKQKAVYYGYQKLRKMEIWFYSNSHPALPPFFSVVFYQPDDNGDFRLYSPYMDGPEKLVTTDPGSRSDSLKVIDQQAGREVARTALSLLPDEPVDLDTAQSSLQSDVMLGTIRNLANNPLNKDILQRHRELLEGVTHRVILGDEFVRVLTVPLRDADGTIKLHYLLRLLRPEDFSVGKASDGRFYYSVEISARVLSPDNKLIYSQQRAVSHYFSAAEYERMKNKSFAYEGMLPITPGKYKVEFVLTNKLHSTAVRASSQVIVPEVPTTGFAIGGMVPFTDAEQIDPQKSATIPFSGSGVRFMPEALQNLEVPLGGDLKVFYQIWGPAVDPRTLAGKKLGVEYAWGRVGISGQVKSVHDDVGREQFDPNGSMLNGKRVSLAEAPQGNYRLVVTVSDPETKQKTFGAMNFQIVSTLTDPSNTWYVFDETADAQEKVGEDEYDRALCYIAAGNHDKALPLLAAALEHNPGNQDAVGRLVGLYFDKKDYVKVASLYPKFAVSKGTNEQTVLQMADALHRAGKLPEAVHLLETTISSRESSGPLLLALSSCYRQMGQTEKANTTEQRGKSLMTNTVAPK